MKRFIPLLLLILSIHTFSQSPWTPKKGGFYTNLSYSSISEYNTLFGDSDYETERVVSDKTFQLYGEYGISNKTSFVFNVPLKTITLGEYTGPTSTPPNVIFIVSNEGSKTAVGNISLGLKHNFYKQDWVISGQLNTELNTSSFDNSTGIRTGYNAWTFTPQLLVGKSFGNSFLQTQVGVDLRTNNYSNNFKIGGEFGYKITPHIWLIGFLDVVKSFDDGTIILPEVQLSNGLYINNQEYAAYGFKGIAEFTNKFGVTAGFGTAFSGRNVPKQAALTVGIYHKF